MHFDVAADAYDRFMGRYSALLSAQLADFAGVRLGQRVLDVGCGPGALLTELARRVGADRVAAVDPSQSFVAAARQRHPGVTVHQASAEDLPFEDDSFDVALAQLVVHFMDRPIDGLAELRRVTRPGGRVAACVWDFGADQAPLSPFWRAARDLDPSVEGEALLAGTRDGQLVELLRTAGLIAVVQRELWVRLSHASFEEWWEPFTAGVGPAGAYLAGLDEDQRNALRERCRQLLPATPLVIAARAWAACGEVA